MGQDGPHLLAVRRIAVVVEMGVEVGGCVLTFLGQIQDEARIQSSRLLLRLVRLLLALYGVCAACGTVQGRACFRCVDLIVCYLIDQVGISMIAFCGLVRVVVDVAAVVVVGFRLLKTMMMRMRMMKMQVALKVDRSSDLVSFCFAFGFDCLEEEAALCFLEFVTDYRSLKE